MKIGIPREVHPGEGRVAAVPATVERLRELGFEVLVETGAGIAASAPDDAYREAGATVCSCEEVWAADVVVKVRPPERHPDLGKDEAELLAEGGTLICLVYPARNAELLKRLAARKATVLALDQIPRTTRAQKCDVLSSMANIAGYRAIIEAAYAYGGFFGLQITAAGRSEPARVLVIGAGVAGLAAIGAARGLGAEVRAFDVRAAAREEVQSLGATFLEVDIEESGEGEGGYAREMSKAFIEAEKALFRKQAEEVDIIITTAQVPGKKAPVLITRDMIEAMKPGSVVVDLAAEQGGNCEVTECDRVVELAGVKVIGYADLPSRLPAQASRFFGNNVAHLLAEMGGAANWAVNLDNPVVGPAVVLRDGLEPPPRLQPVQRDLALKLASKAAPAPALEPSPPEARPERGRIGAVIGLVAAVALAVAAAYAPAGLLQHLTVFVLACFVGWQVIWNVTPALHTPLMSVTNAISGIIIVGGMLQAGARHGAHGIAAATVLGAIAIFFASINVAGGFLVTQRMLRMFRRDDASAGGANAR